MAVLALSAVVQGLLPVVATVHHFASSSDLCDPSQELVGTGFAMAEAWRAGGVPPVAAPDIAAEGGPQFGYVDKGAAGQPVALTGTEPVLDRGSARRSRWG